MTSASIAIPGTSTKNTKYSETRQIPAEHSSAILGLASAALTQTVARFQHSVAMNIDFPESGVSSSCAVSSLDETGAMTSSSQPGEAARIPDLAHRIQVVSMSPFATPLSLGSINSMDEFLKLQEQTRCNPLRSGELTYLSSDQLAAIIGDSKGISIAKDSLVPGSLFGQQLYHIASVPVSMPSLTPKPDVSAVESSGDLRSVDLKPHLAHAWKTDEPGNRHGVDVGKEVRMEVMEKSEEPDGQLSERDETTSTDSAKDTDQEDMSLELKQAMYRHERRRWASADADQFTSSSKTLGRSPNKQDFSVAADQQWRNCASGFLHQHFEDGEGMAGDGPPVIDDVRDLNTADGGHAEFRSPNAALLKFRRKNRPEPLIIPPQTPGFAFHSRLRSPRIMGKSFDTKPPFTPYTPPPMLSPIRNGSGLFCQLSSKSPVSAPVALRTGLTPRRS